MIQVAGSAPTSNAAKYIKQLCNHWSHKLAVEQSDDQGVVQFPAAKATMVATETGVTITIDGADSAAVEQLKGVVQSHLDRFAFREAPLRYNWSDGQGR